MVCKYSIRYSCHILMKIQFSRQIFGKHSNIKLHDIPSSGSRVVPSGETEDRHTDLTKLIVAFRKLSNTTKVFMLCNHLSNYRRRYVTLAFLRAIK